MSFLRRTLAGASATAVLAGALVVGTAAPASAVSSTFCPHASSTRVFTANNGQYKVWLYRTTTYYGSDEYHLCYASSPVVGGDIVVGTGLSGSVVPTVNYSLSDPTCPDFFTVQDPVQLVTEMSLGSAPWNFCFGVGNNSAIRVQFGLPTVSAWPYLQLWVDRYSNVGQTYCNAVNDWQCYYYTDGVRVRLT